MNNDRKPILKAVTKYSATLLLGVVATLWSWNTLAEWFGGPQAQFKHAIAATLLALIIRWTITTTAGTGRSPRSAIRTARQ